MAHDRTYDEASEVEAEDGKVVVDGPDAVAVTLTPEAASETSDRLLFGAAKAQGQKIAADRRRRASATKPNDERGTGR